MAECRDYTPGTRPEISEGEDIVRYSGKPETAAITPAARTFWCGVTASKESCNVVFPWDGGANKFRGKTPKSALAEWVFIDEPRVYFDRQEVDGRHLQVGQVTGPQGPRSTLTHYDFLFQPTLVFHVLSFEDRVTQPQWQKILMHAQMNGLGALRSQSMGQFKVTGFEPLPDTVDRDTTLALAAKRAEAKEKTTKRKTKKQAEAETE